MFYCQLKKDLIDEIIIAGNKYLLNSINNSSFSSGLYSGTNGLFLYTKYHSSYFKRKSFLSKSQLEWVVSLSTKFSPTFSNFSYGSSGKLWAFNLLAKNNLIYFDDEIFQTTTEHFHEELMRYAKEKNWDNLHGAFGILYYLTELKILTEANLNTFLLLFQKETFLNKEFIYLKSRFSLENKAKKTNLSLSHGLSGNIVILTKVSLLFPNNKLLWLILESMISFLLKLKAEFPRTGYFPSLINEKDNTHDRNTRLAWCYGDLGPGIALYRVSLLKKDLILYGKALEILLYTSRRRNNDSDRISDIPFCHGVVGIMHIFNRLYKETGLNEFKVASDYWLEIIFSVYKKNGVSGFASKTGPQDKFELLPCLLNGLSGINLALLSKLYPELDSDWDGCFFLN
jgi:hypothetical protein